MNELNQTTISSFKDMCIDTATNYILNATKIRCSTKLKMLLETTDSLYCASNLHFLIELYVLSHIIDPSPTKYL
jgi:hypothetical protein